MFETTIAGSLPKPRGSPSRTCCGRRGSSSGDALAAAKRDATLLAIKQQEDAGIDIVSDGEQSRQHFVHGFLENVEGIDFGRRVEMGIRNDRYKAMVPTVDRSAAPARPRARDRGAAGARAHHAQAEVHAAGTDDDRRYDRRYALRRPRRAGDGVRRAAEPGGACARSGRRRCDPVR